MNGFDEIFMDSEDLIKNQLPKIFQIPLTEIDDFPDHPFKVKMDEDMNQLVESIKERGVITLITLRKKEDGRYHRARPDRNAMTLNDYWEKYISMKCEISENTLVSYIYLYNRHIRNDFGKRPVDSIKYADVKRFYIRLISYGLNISSISNVHNIIHPVLDLAVREGDIEKNPSENVLAEMRRRKDWGVEHREALTAAQQEALVKYASESYQYRMELFPMLTVFLGTGMRLGELTALTWQDIDFANNVILVRKTLNNKTTLSGKYGYRRRTAQTSCRSRIILMC